MAKYFNRFTSFYAIQQTVSKIRSNENLETARSEAIDAWNSHNRRIRKHGFDSYTRWASGVKTIMGFYTARKKQIDKRQYVEIPQGFAGDYLSDTTNPDRITYLDGPKQARWGSGVYAVNDDGSLELFSCDWDSSG